MSRVLLDSSAYSALHRGHRELLSEVQLAREIYVSSVVLGELYAGFRRGNRTAGNEANLRRFLAIPRVDVLPVTEETAQRYAVILNDLRDAGAIIPTNDIWIAATAMEHGLRLLTTDRHYERVRQIVVSCFEPTAP